MAEAAGDVESGGGGGDGDEAGVPIAAAPAPPVSSTVTTAVGGFANDLRRRGDAQDPCAARPLCSVAECDTTEGDAALSEASELATVAVLLLLLQHKYPHRWEEEMNCRMTAAASQPTAAN